METGVEDGCKVQRNKGEGDRGRLRWEAKEQGRGWGENRKGEGGGEKMERRKFQCLPQ